MNGFILAVSSSLAASIVAKVTVTTALGLLGAWLMRGSSAAVRHALLTAAFAVLLVLPIISLLAPPLRVFVRERVAPASAVRTAISFQRDTVRTNVSATSESPRSAGLTLSDLLLTGWLAGMALLLLPVAMGLWELRSLRKCALPWRHAQPVLDGLAREAGLHRRVEVLLNEALSGPMACGILHPAIVLPQEAETWAAEDLNRAIVHELEHVRRADWIGHCLARAVCAAYWFHPLVWLAWRRLSVDAERACDDAVLERSEATAYADQLVELAKRLSTSAKPPLLAMANRADLATRVTAVLDSRQRRGRAGKSRVAIACGAAVLLVLVLSPLKVVAAPQTAADTIAAAASVREFISKTSLVIVDVAVSGQDGKPIEGLHFGDFVVMEDGRRQALDVFEPVKPDSLLSYYIRGYYTPNQTADGQYRKIEITYPRDPAAKLNYRAGYDGQLFRPVYRPNPAAQSDGVTPPIPLNRPEAQYSEEARKAKLGGTVILLAEVDESGKVAKVTVSQGLGLGLDQKAVQSATKWTFMPARKDGQPVAARIQLNVTFELL